MSRSPKGVAQRARILDTAFSVLVEHGYERTSLQRIARAAGVTTSGVMHYFASKAELFTEVLKYRRRDWDERRPAGDAIVNYVEASADNADRDGLVRLFHHLAVDGTDAPGPVRSFFTDHYEQAVRRLSRSIRERRPDLDERSVRSRARAVVALSDGLQLQWLYDRDLDLYDEYRRAVELLIEHPTNHPAPPASIAD